MPVTDAQKRAQQKYNANNRKKRNLLMRYHAAKNFIKGFATEKQLKSIKELVDGRLSEVPGSKISD